MWYGTILFSFFLLTESTSTTLNPIPTNGSVSAFKECGFLGKEFYHNDHNRRLFKRAFVMGGNEINVNAVPWVIRIDSYGKHSCTGTLISNRHVLTAGHCFTTVRGCIYDVSEYSVCHLISNNNRTCPKKQKYSIKKIHFLDEYMEEKCPSEHDFVVLELKKSIKGARPACLPIPSNGVPDEYEFSEDANLLGYSRNFDFQGSLSWANTKLKSVNVGIPKLCKEDGMLCTEYREEGGICQGDSGGPMIEVLEGRAVLIGVNVEANGNCVIDKIDRFEGSTQQFAINVHKHVYDIVSVMKAGQEIDIEGSGETGMEGSGGIVVEGSGKVDVEGTGKVEVEGSGEIEVEGSGADVTIRNGDDFSNKK